MAFVSLTINNHRSHFGSRFSHCISKPRNMTSLGPRLASLCNEIERFNQEEADLLKMAKNLDDQMVELCAQMATVNGRLAMVNDQRAKIYGEMASMQANDGDSPSFLSPPRVVRPPKMVFLSPEVVSQSSDGPSRPQKEEGCNHNLCGCGDEPVTDENGKPRVLSGFRRCIDIHTVYESQEWSSCREGLQCGTSVHCDCDRLLPPHRGKPRTRFGKYYRRFCGKYIRACAQTLKSKLARCEFPDCECGGEDLGVKVVPVDKEDSEYIVVCKRVVFN